MSSPVVFRATGTQAIVLVGHGSRLNPQSAAPVHAHVARIRSRGIFDEVRAAFWKEAPSLRDVLDVVTSDDVYVVPLFMADGWFTRVVLPRELRRAIDAGSRCARRAHYARPVGAHPGMARLVLRRAHACGGLTPAERRRAALVLIGHGTGRIAGSGSTLYRLRDALDVTAEFAHVECGFLDEAPHIADVLRRVSTRDVVLVPFFMADGWHAGTTIPQDLALDEATRATGARRVWYSQAVGTLSEVADIAVAVAVSAGARPAGGPRNIERLHTIDSNRRSA